MKRRSLQLAMRPLLAAAAGAAIALAGAWGLGVFESGWSDAGVTDAYAAGFAAGAEQGLADQAAMQAEEAAAAASDRPAQAVPLSVLREVGESEDVPSALFELWPIRCILDQVLRNSCWVNVRVTARGGEERRSIPLTTPTARSVRRA